MERGALLVLRGAEERPGDRYGEAADVFQRMRRRNERLTLFGEGDGCAVVLMLAQRFAPDALWLYPCGGTDADGFFRALGACGGNLFAVCAPIDVFLPEDMEEGIERRILRALRFASVYGFRIDDATSQAAHDLRHTLTDVAAERIRVELAKLLCGQGAADILRAYPDVVFVLLPQLRAMHGFDQHNPHHRYDVWEHTLRALPHIPPTETLRLAILLHDSGKPDCFTLDEAGIGHMHGHAERSAEIADEVLSSLRVDNATRERVTLLVRSHSLSVSPDPKLLRRRLNQLGEEALRELLLLQRADQLGKGTISPEEIKAEYRTVVAALDALMATSPCFTLKSLAVSGRDLMAAGLPKGHIVGQALAYLLDEVMAERLPNARDALLDAAIRQFGGMS